LTQANIKAVFLDALDRAPLGERSAFLDEACAGDAVFRQRVDALLQAHGRPDRLLDQTAPEHFGGEPPYSDTASAGLGLDSNGDDSLAFLAPSQNPDSLGRLSRYEVLDVAGRGSTGIVLRAFDESLERVVAIKVLAPRLARIRAARQRFAREARAAAGVSDDNVITIYSVTEAGPVPFMVMPFMSGQSLQEKLDQTGALPLAETLHIGWHIAKGLAAAHRRGLVHRDVKPANILLENGVERVKLTDFGLARASHDAGASRSAVARPAHAGLSLVAGTPMYMSPEQADGLPVDFRSDLFSLGSVLYAMCAGRPPFRAPSPVAVLKRVCEETPRPITQINPELPRWLEELVVRLHDKAPADRFASAREVADLLAQRLAELQHGGTPSAIVPPPSTKMPAENPALAPPGRPRRRWLTAAAILPALLAGLALSEAMGVTKVRGTVIRLFSPEKTLAIEADDLGVSVAADAAAWERAVAALPAEEQIQVVAARLKDLNPGFEGKVTPTIREDVVYGLTFSTDQVTNIAPVRALTKLKVLKVPGNPGKLADLSPLNGMSLLHLNFSQTQVSDLSPLQGMHLTWLECGLTSVSDLTPLKGMPLRRLFCQCSQVSDLTPLRGMHLVWLDVGGSAVTDLSPLKGMRLKELGLNGAAQLRDLSPLKGAPLELLNIGRTKVADLSPLEDMIALHTLVLAGTLVADLSRLKRVPLKTLKIQCTKVSDLSPLKGMSLNKLWLDLPTGQNAEVLRSLKNLEQINGETPAEFWKAHEK
jgi:eukaryotic-like serine/threonine-protein kinase